MRIKNIWNNAEFDEKTLFRLDSYYRLKNNAKLRWRTFLTTMAKQAISTMEQRSSVSKASSIKNVTAFIFDDTPISKCGSLIEGVSMVWNHVIRKSMLGYQLLVMTVYTGTTTLPVDFSFHREQGKNKKSPFGLSHKHNKRQYKKKRGINTAGKERKKELDISKISSVVKMIKNAIKNNIVADYVLADSWFTCLEIVQITIKYKMQFIGMFSKVKPLFTYRNKRLTYKEIRRINRRNIKRNKRFNLYYIRTVVEWKGQPIVLYFTRQGRRGNWKTILSTDLSINFTKTIEIYQLRWSIEVFFKECKQLLDLGKSQSTDFDAQIADTTITLIQYIFLALRNSVEKYESIGQLFRNTKADVLELKLHERLVGLLIATIEAIDFLIENIDSDELFMRIINNEQALQKILRIINLPKDTFKTAA